MKSLRTRLLQLLGIMVVLLGLTGYWLTKGTQQTLLSHDQLAMLNPSGESFQVSFLLAGRDYAYTRLASQPRFDSRGRIIGWARPAQSNPYGTNTDTIFYVNIVGNRIHMVAIPRDVYLEQYRTKINAMYYYRQAEGLKQAVSELLGLPIDYYAIINIDIFQRLVDALGGVDVNVPYRMYYTDHAGQLFIDLQPGPQRLDGEAAAGFARFRQTPLGDYNRIDNIKSLANAMLTRLKQLHVRAVGAVPELVNSYFDEIETNADLGLVLRMLPRLSEAEIYAVTLPTHIVSGTSNLAVRPREVEALLAQTFGGEAREVSEIPETSLLITNRSGIPGLEMWLQEWFIALGVPEENMVVRSAPIDPTPSHVLADLQHWQDAGFYASLLDVGRQQVVQLEAAASHSAGLEIVLGADAALMSPRYNLEHFEGYFSQESPDANTYSPSELELSQNTPRRP